MPSSSENNGKSNPPLHPADAANQIHQLTSQAIGIAKEAKLDYLVYLLKIVEEESKQIARLSSAKRTKDK